MKRSWSVFLLLSVLFVLFMGGKPKEQKNLNYRITEQGSNIALRERSPSITVFTDEGDFNAFYRYLHMNKIPIPEPPEIDFSRSLLLFVSYGEQRTAGYSIEIRKVYERNGTLVVQAVLLGPPGESLIAQVITTPYLLMTVSREHYRRVELVGEIGEVLAQKKL